MSVLLNLAVSALDTPSSLIPFFVKDSFDVTGRTIMAGKEGGMHEARERFIEEAGTSLFWIGGIPAVRGIVNQFVKRKIDPTIHFKRINTEGIQNYYADKLNISANKPKFSKSDLEGIELGGSKLAEIQEKLKKTGFKPNEGKGLYKKYHLGVTTAAVLVNLVVLMIALPKLNQLLSRKIIAKEVRDAKKQAENENSDTLEFGKDIKLNQKETQMNGKSPAFTGLKALCDFKNLLNFTEMAEGAQLNPVNGMLLLDYGISGGRVIITPRNNNERIENAIKEGGIIFFFYFAADVIKNQICKLADKVFNRPIDLDYQIMNSKEFLDKLKNPHKKEDVLKFAEIQEGDAKAELKVIKLIDKELAGSKNVTNKEELFKNFTLQMAQKERLIDVEYDDKLQKWIRHSKKYIQTDKLINLNDNLKNFYEKAFAEIKNSYGEKNIEMIISKTKKVKIASVFANIAICCASLSYILPKIQYMIREHRTQTKAAPGIKHYQDMAVRNEI